METRGVAQGQRAGCVGRYALVWRDAAAFLGGCRYPLTLLDALP